MSSKPGSRTWPKTLCGKNSAAETIGTVLLVSLLFSSAISETLNNVLIVLLFIWWLSTQSAVRDLRAAPLYLLIIVLFCTTPLVSVATSTVGEPSDRLRDVTGAVKLALLLLPIYSMSSRNRASVDLVTACLTAGAIIASVDTIAPVDAPAVWQQLSVYYPDLRALAGVNGSALYMSVVLVSAIALAWSPKLPLSILGYVGIMISLWFSLVSDSITSLTVSVCVLFLAGIMSMFTKRRKEFLPVIACLAIFSGVALATTDAHFYWKKLTHEFTSKVYGDKIGSYRFEIFNTAAEVYDRNLWFGSGYRQFGKATSVEIVADELDKEGRSYEDERGRFFHTGHGHNVWTQVLVERGLVGIGLLLFFFLVTGFRIFRNVFDLHRQRERDLELVQLAFISSAVWTMLFVGGVGNSTFHIEHGMVALLLLVWSLTGFDVSEKRMPR